MVALLAAAGSLACGDDRAPAPRDSVAAIPPIPGDTATPVPPAPGWEPSFGPALFDVGGDGQLGVVMPLVTDATFADSATWAGATTGDAPAVELFSVAGRSSVVPLAPRTPVPMPAVDDGCVVWPTVRTATRPPAGTVGFAQGSAVALPLDSIAGLARPDSARLAAEAARLASQIPNDTATAFAGLPFVVRAAYVLRVAPGVEVLVADVARRIGQEADPREQLVFLVAERSAPGAAWRLAWFERTSGPEDSVESRELRAAVALGPGRTPTLVVIVTYIDGSSWSLVSRGIDGTWRERWTSAYTGC